MRALSTLVSFAALSAIFLVVFAGGALITAGLHRVVVGGPPLTAVF